MIRRLWHRLQLAVERYQARRDISTLAGAMVQAGDDPARVFDGVNYVMPILLPDTLRRDLESRGQLQAFLHESYDRATNFQFDNPYKTDLPFTPVTDDPLTEWDYSTRKYVLEQCHAAFQRNPDARVGVKHIANFAIGEGFTLSVHNDEVRALLDDFIAHPMNRIREYERQAASDLLVDGELVLRCAYDPDMGQLFVVPQRPWELQYIETELSNYRSILRYWFQFEKDQGQPTPPGGQTDTEWVDVDPDEIIFVAINNHAYELRGRSELYPILPWLKARKDWLENRARINYWLSVILWKVNVDTNNPSALASVRSRWATPPKPGSIAVEHKAVEVEAMQATPAAPEAADDGRQLLMQVAKGFGLPEYFLGDGENANLASASRQQLPAIVKFEDYQRTLIMELWEPLFKKVIQMAVDAGLLPALVQKQNGVGEPIAGELIPAVESFEVKYQDIRQEDIFALSQALQIQLQNDITSKRMARQSLGYDPDMVEKDLDEEKEKLMQDMAQGLIPRPPMMRDEALAPDESPDEEEPEGEYS